MSVDLNTYLDRTFNACQQNEPVSDALKVNALLEDLGQGELEMTVRFLRIIHEWKFAMNSITPKRWTQLPVWRQAQIFLQFLWNVFVNRPLGRLQIV